MSLRPIRYQLTVPIWILMLAAGGSAAQSPTLETTAPIFMADGVQLIRIEAPISDIVRNRGDDPDYFPGTLSYIGNDGQTVTLPLRVRTRGKSRNREETCDFPPLMLNFPRQQTDGTLFAGENRLKLVTHCQTAKSYHDYVLLEYLNYRALQLLTGHGLLTRWLEVEYVNTGGSRDFGTRQAFLLEDIDRMAGRLGMTIWPEHEIARDRYDHAALNLAEVFEYFLGNTDWSATRGPGDDACCHNIIPLARADGMLVPVPYDFDSTGVVNAPYSMPAEHLRIRNVRQRLYRGSCQPREIVDATIARFQERRGDLLNLYQDERLSSGTRRRVENYLEQFFEVLDDPGRVEREFITRCRN